MDKRLRKEFEEYCELNEIEGVEDFIGKCTKDGFTLDKYGVAPFLPKSQIQEIPVEKEVIKEVIVEVEKEVIVEKYQDELLDKDKTINEQQIELKKQEDILEHFKKVTVNRRAQYMKSSNLDDTYLD